MKKNKIAWGVAGFFGFVLLLFGATPSFQTFDIHQFGTNTVNNIAVRRDAWMTNVNFFASANSFTNGCITLWPVLDNTDSAAINIYSQGTQSAAIIHVQNSNSFKAVDFGLWSESFGPSFTGKYVFDAYDVRFGTNLGPGIQIEGSGIYPFDSGVISHPMQWWDMTNLNTYFMGALVDSRVGDSDTYFDHKNRMFHNVTTANGNIRNGTGTVTVTGQVLSGFGTSFLTELQHGSIVSIGVTNFTVTRIDSATTAHVAELGTLLGAGAFTITPTAFVSQGSSTNSWYGGVGGHLIIYGESGNTILSGVNFASTYRVWDLIWGPSAFKISDATAGTLPFQILNGALDNSQIIDAAGKAGFTNGAAVAGTFSLPIGTAAAGYVWMATNNAGLGFWGQVSAGTGSITNVSMPVGYNVDHPGGANVAITYSNVTGISSTNIDFSVNSQFAKTVTGATAFQMTNEPNVGYATMRIWNNATANVITMTASTGRTNYWLGGVNFSNVMDAALCDYFVQFYTNENHISLQQFK